MAERVVLVCDVCGRPAQESVTFRIGTRTLAKDLCPAHVEELVRNSRAPRRGRRPHAALLSSVLPKRPGRPLSGTDTHASEKRPTVERRRKRNTDPATLEKRRAALEKARQALAKKRAAAKKAG